MGLRVGCVCMNAAKKKKRNPALMRYRKKQKDTSSVDLNTNDVFNPSLKKNAQLLLAVRPFHWGR